MSGMLIDVDTVRELAILTGAWVTVELCNYTDGGLETQRTEEGFLRYVGAYEDLPQQWIDGQPGYMLWNGGHDGEMCRFSISDVIQIIYDSGTPTIITERLREKK